MNTETRRRVKELTRALEDLGLPHPPLERFKLASRLWRLLAGFSREERRQLLREFGGKGASDLERLVEGGAENLPKSFLEFVERSAQALTPERISSMIGSLALAGAEASSVPNALANDSNLPASDEADTSPDGIDDDVSAPPLDTLRSETESSDPESETARDSAAAGSGSPPSEAQRPVLPPPLAPTDSAGASEEPSAISAIEPTAQDRVETEARRPAKLEPTRSHQARVKEFADRCAQLDSTWKRRRFWLNVVRSGFEAESAEGILRAVSECGLPPQDYVWVVDEMAVYGRLPEILFADAIELAPSESAARLLSRRLPVLASESSVSPAHFARQA